MESSFETMRRTIEQVSSNNQIEKLSQEQLDMSRMFKKVFESPDGVKVLEHLEIYSHKNFPNYNNVYL